MANEITYSISVGLSNGGVQDNYATGSKTANQTTAALVKNVQAIGTTAAGEALDLGSVITPGIAYFVNPDATSSSETIQIGVQTGDVFYPLVKMKAAEKAMFRLTAAPYAKASAGTINLMYAIYAA